MTTSDVSADQMTHEERCLWLAALEEPCAACKGTGIYSASSRPGELTTNSFCSTCHGMGKVARFPWLRKVHGLVQHPWGVGTMSCSEAGCPGWEPVLPGDPAYKGAMWDLLVWVLQQLWPETGPGDWYTSR